MSTQWPHRPDIIHHNFLRPLFSNGRTSLHSDAYIQRFCQILSLLRLISKSHFFLIFLISQSQQVACAPVQRLGTRNFTQELASAYQKRGSVVCKELAIVASAYRGSGRIHVLEGRVGGCVMYMASG